MTVWAPEEICPSIAATDGFRQPEVEHLDLTVGRYLDVGRLQVPVNHTFLVRGFEGFGDLDGECEGFFDWDCAAFESFRQRVAFDEFETEKPRGVVLFGDRRSQQCWDGSTTPAASLRAQTGPDVLRLLQTLQAAS